MQFLVLATDYDGTIAADGRINDATRGEIRPNKASTSEARNRSLIFAPKTLERSCS